MTTLARTTTRVMTLAWMTPNKDEFVSLLCCTLEKERRGKRYSGPVRLLAYLPRERRAIVHFSLLFPFLWAQVNNEHHERIDPIFSSSLESAFYYNFTVPLGLERGRQD